MIGRTLVIVASLALALAWGFSFAHCAERGSSPPPSQAGDSGRLVKLHETRWSIGGKPVLGTYGADSLESLRRAREVGMNLVLGGDKELDARSPEGAFCLASGIKVMPHLTPFVYHGVRLREPITAGQKDIPLVFANGRVEQASHIIQIDDESIRYERMTDAGLVNCQRGSDGTTPAAHREGIILFWPEACRAEVMRIKDSPNLFGYYVLDDSPGDAVSALRAMYRVIHQADPNPDRPVCAGFGDAGSITNLAAGVCDIMLIYWYPVGTTAYDRDRTAQEVQHMLATARRRVPGIPFMGIYQAFDGRPAHTGQGVPDAEQLREQLEDFVREGACGLVAFLCHSEQLPGWADLAPLGTTVARANREVVETGGLVVRAETPLMARKRIQPQGRWDKPRGLPGYVPAWYVLAPFEDTAGKGLEMPVPPERGIDLAGVYPVKSGLAGWRIRETTGGVLGLAEIYGAIKHGLAYAVCDVTSDETRAVQMHISSDDAAWVRLNGKEIYRFDGSRGLEMGGDIVPLALPRGTSRLEVKIYNRAGMWGFFVRFTDPQGRPVEGVRFSPDQR